jgi:hypothetical protein
VTKPVERAAPAKPATISTTEIAALKAELLRRHPVAEQAMPATAARIARGLQQAASLWRVDSGAAAGEASDGDFATFVREHYIVDASVRQATLARFEAAFEQLDGPARPIAARCCLLMPC